VFLWKVWIRSRCTLWHTPTLSPITYFVRFHLREDKSTTFQSMKKKSVPKQNWLKTKICGTTLTFKIRILRYETRKYFILSISIWYKEKMNLSSTVWGDLEIFSCYRGKKSNYFFKWKFWTLNRQPEYQFGVRLHWWYLFETSRVRENAVR
jgi:hypothetical protein